MASTSCQPFQQELKSFVSFRLALTCRTSEEGGPVFGWGVGRAPTLPWAKDPTVCLTRPTKGEGEVRHHCERTDYSLPWPLWFHVTPIIIPTLVKSINFVLERYAHLPLTSLLNLPITPWLISCPDHSEKKCEKDTWYHAYGTHLPRSQRRKHDQRLTYLGTRETVLDFILKGTVTRVVSIHPSFLTFGPWEIWCKKSRLWIYITHLMNHTLPSMMYLIPKTQVCWWWNGNGNGVLTELREIFDSHRGRMLCWILVSGDATNEQP